MKTIAIHSNQTITPEGVKDAIIIIRNGIITEIANSIPDKLEIEYIDVGNKVVMAGVIDPHVHINEPGRTDWEGFNTATKSAIAGGITTLVDMPLNSSPVTTKVQAFEEKLAATDGQLHTNCGFWGGIIPGNENEVEPLINMGVLGFKAFLTHSGIDEFPNVTETDLRKVMPAIAASGLPLLVHCELESGKKYRVQSSRSYNDYLLSRPRKWEDDAIALVIKLCEEYNCRVHIVHLSSADSIVQIQKAKEKGLPLTVETGQHYLYFNSESIGDGETQFKCAPPIREKENNERLWEGLREGIIDFVATDHSPAPPIMKLPDFGDFMQSWGGIASLQFALPALWTAARQRGFDLIDIAKWLCQNSSRLTGYQNNKGLIKKGYDADLVIWDEKATFMIDKDMILHKHKISPYIGERLYGVVEQTFISGEKVFDRGTFALNKGKIIRKTAN